MKTRKLGRTDLDLTEIGLGTWAIGGGKWQFGWGPQDDSDSIKTIHRAISLGINWIDTAAVYGLGHSEEIVGKAIKNLLEKPIIATKCGREWDGKGRIRGNLKKDRIRKEIEESLRRLQVEIIDLYQIHHPNPDEEIEEAWQVIADAVKRGEIRYTGVSNFNVSQLKRVQAIHPVASIQPRYNILSREIEQDLLPYCAENDIGVVVYSPMGKGLLTGTFSEERMRNLPVDDHRRNDPKFQPSQLPIQEKLVEKLRLLAEEQSHTVAQLAIAWCLRRPEVTSAIVGGRKAWQIEETAQASAWQLEEEDINRIDTLLEEYRKNLNHLQS